jgi:hypothetical protein
MHKILILLLLIFSFNLHAKSHLCTLAVHNRLDASVTISFYKLSHDNEKYGPRQVVEIPADEHYVLSFTNVVSYHWQVITPVSKVADYNGVALTSCNEGEGGKLVIHPQLN